MMETVGDILNKWRKKQRYSQLQLALELTVSSKHISFIETGRSIPSKEMILKISLFLFMPKREINRALYLAGHAPVYTELSASDESLKPVFDAVDKMIENHMPYPALVLNQCWDVVKVNLSAQKLLVDIGFSKHTNLLEALIVDKPEFSKIINWHEVVSTVLSRLKQEISLLGGSEHLQEYEKRLSNLLQESSESFNADDIEQEVEKTIPTTQIQLNEKILSFFSIIAQLGSIQDITLSEYKVELMFPSNEQTKTYYL